MVMGYGITLAMIVRNEGKTLARCLESAAPIVDQIVVVDTGSEDDTLQIAASFGARALESSWQDSFGHARNISLDAVETEWVLVLDGDEWLDDSASQCIESVTSATIGGAILRRFDVYSDGTHGEGQFLRLWRHHPTIRYRTHIHEQIMPDQIIDAWHLPVTKSDILVWHDGYAHEPTQERLVFDEKLLRKQLDAEPHSDYFKVVLLANLVRQRKQDAWPLLNQVIEHALGYVDHAFAPVPEYQTAFCILLENTPPEYHDAPIPQAVAKLGLKWFSDSPTFLSALGDFEVRANHVEHALDVYKKMDQLRLSGEASTIRSFHPAMLGQDLFIRLAVIARHAGDRDTAINALNMLRSADPENPALQAELKAWES